MDENLRIIEQLLDRLGTLSNEDINVLKENLKQYLTNFSYNEKERINFTVAQKLLSKLSILNEQEMYLLKEFIAPFEYLNNDDEYIEAYNKLSKQELKKLVDFIKIKYLTDKFISKINDKTCLIAPYDETIDLIFSQFKTNEDLLRLYLNSEIFYTGIQNYKQLDYISYKLSQENIKFFVENCSIYNENIVLEYLKNEVYTPSNYILANIPDSIKEMYMKKIDDSDKMLKYYTKLSDEKKIEVYRSEWFRNIVDVTNIYNIRDLVDHSPDEIIEELSDKVGISCFLNNYLEQKIKRTIYLKKFLEKIDLDDLLLDDFNSTKIFNLLFLISNKAYEELGEGNYKSKLIDLINKIDSEVYIEYYFKIFFTYSNQSNVLKDIMFKRAYEILATEKIDIGTISLRFFELVEKEKTNMIIPFLKKSDLLLLSIRNQYIYEYVIKILMDNPKYFEGIEIDNVNKFSIPKIQRNEITQFIDKGKNISQYLSEEQLNIFYIPFFIENDFDIKIRYINSVCNNPELLADLKSLKYFSDEQISYIIDNLSIDRLMYLFFYKNIIIENSNKRFLLNDCLDKRMVEITNYINNPLNLLNITKSQNLIRVCSLTNKVEEFVSLIDDMEILSFVVVEYKNKVLHDIVLSRFIEILQSNVELSVFNHIPYFNTDIERKNFLDSLSFEVVISIICNECNGMDLNDSKVKEYINYLKNKIDEDINCLFNINIISKLENIFTILPIEYTNKIQTYIDNKFELIKEKYPKLINYINTYGDKANYIMGISNNYINDNNIDKIYNMLEKNPYLFSTMDFRLLTSDMLKMGNYFVDKTSRHPIISSKLYKIYEQDKEKFNIIVLLSNKMRKENNDSVYDQKIEIIIDYLLKNNIQIPTEIDENYLYNLENYILDQTINKNKEYKNLDISNYISLKNNIIDERILKASTLKELKNLMYQKYLGLNEKEIEDFLYSYAQSWNTLNVNNESINNYINNIFIIKNSIDINSLKENIMYLNYYNISDNMYIKSMMINEYNKNISNEIKENAVGKNTTIVINGKQIEVEEFSGNFGIFVHSTNAYGKMPLINNNYYDSWNNNPNTRNHGICASYITNSSYGTAAVKDNGVMFGFTNIEENGLALIAPYDLGTINDGYVIKSVHRPWYSKLSEISNHTRHTHNEVSIERRIYSEDGSSYLRQPDSIIIFEDMPDEIKQNSIKAYEDYKAQGIELKIIYIDRVKNAKMEAQKINELLNIYINTYDIKLLGEIINIYESNICGCDFIGTGLDISLNLFDQNELFSTNRLNKVLHDTVDYINSIDDEIERTELANKFIQIINYEQSKFDMIKDFNPKRVHKFTLIDEELKEKINGLDKILETRKVK